MAKQTTVRLPEALAEDAEAVARVRDTSVNQLIVDFLAAEIDRVRANDDFTQRAKRLLERDKELLERLAKYPLPRPRRQRAAHARRGIRRRGPLPRCPDKAAVLCCRLAWNHPPGPIRRASTSRPQPWRSEPAKVDSEAKRSGPGHRPGPHRFLPEGGGSRG